MKLWGGRFEAVSSEVFERFSGSLHFDKKLVGQGLHSMRSIEASLLKIETAL